MAAFKSKLIAIIISIIIIAIVFYCFDFNISNQIHNIDNDIAKQYQIKGSMEGNALSKDRWNYIQKHIKYIKVGMKKLEIIELLGYPNAIEFSPPDIMEYSYYDPVYDEVQRFPAIHIFLDSNQKVIEIKKDNFVYGPPLE